MAFFTDVTQHLAVLRSVCGMEDVPGERLPEVLAALGDDDVVQVIAQASALVRAGEQLRIAAAGVAAARSAREQGHAGLAQSRGHRSPVTLVQELSGSSRADALKQVRLGESLMAALPSMDPESMRPDPVEGRDPGLGADAADDVGAAGSSKPWHAPLGRALLTGVLSSAQHDAILRGLGEPPSEGTTCEDDTAQGGDEAPWRDAGSWRVAWAVAAEQLVEEAAERTVEELLRSARTVRDLLDPAAAQCRFDDRLQARSFRMWVDRDGVHRASIGFDDEMAAWVSTIIDSALRPRRGGPRFVDPDEKARAQELVEDPRTNEQLTYDLIMDTLRSGALADVETVFGTRQAGVRIVITENAFASTLRGEPSVAVAEDDQTALPGWLADQRACDTGTAECVVDRDGNPLYLGRGTRLFTSQQRLALAIRDGGCRWTGCDRPASYCEAHHIDEWAADRGRTDVDRGILLCRFHHMQLHHHAWRITRDGLDDFLLHSPPGRNAGDDASITPIVLKKRLALRYAWGAGAPPPPPPPPPRMFRPEAACRRRSKSGP